MMADRSPPGGASSKKAQRFLGKKTIYIKQPVLRDDNGVKIIENIESVYFGKHCS